MLHQLAPSYIDTGKARVIYRHFAFLGAESDWAAQAAECAGEQNQFWTYGNYLFTHQAGENAGAFARDKLARIAGQVGLDSAAFSTCFNSGRFAAIVKQDTNEGRQRGVRSTPTFFFNGQKIEGLPAGDRFTALIDSLQPKY